MKKRVYALKIRVEHLENELEVKQKELEEARYRISVLTEKFIQLNSQSTGTKLTVAEIFSRAMASTAERAGTLVDELESSINLFVTAVQDNHGANFMGRALDDAMINSVATAKNAGLTADAAQAKHQTAGKLLNQTRNVANAAGVHRT